MSYWISYKYMRYTIKSAQGINMAFADDFESQLSLLLKFKFHLVLNADRCRKKLSLKVALLMADGIYKMCYITQYYHKP